MPVSSARISVADAKSPPKTPRSTGSKNSIALAPSEPVRPTRLEEQDGRRGQAAELDLAGDLFDELVALLLVGSYGRLIGRPPLDRRPVDWGRHASADGLNAS